MPIHPHAPFSPYALAYASHPALRAIIVRFSERKKEIYFSSSVLLFLLLWIESDQPALAACASRSTRQRQISPQLSSRTSIESCSTALQHLAYHAVERLLVHEHTFHDHCRLVSKGSPPHVTACTNPRCLPMLMARRTPAVHKLSWVRTPPLRCPKSPSRAFVAQRTNSPFSNYTILATQPDTALDAGVATG